jgi:hypothetical protein
VAIKFKAHSKSWPTLDNSLSQTAKEYNTSAKMKIKHELRG